MNDPIQTQDQTPVEDVTNVVPNVLIDMTAVGAPTIQTLARATRPNLPGYELHEVVGKGGMGIVYRARQVNLDRDIAIKFLRDDFHPKSATGLRFMEEARITAQLQHPGIPAVHEVGTLADDRPYLVMKLIRGRTLDSLLKEQGPGTTKWLAVFESICHAVGFAHAHNVVHRDLKPSNVMVGAFGGTQVMDWGLAKVVGGRETQFLMAAIEDHTRPDEALHIRDSGSVQTRAGSYLGTPAFMAPEQATGDVDKISPRTDVFGLGAVLCTLMTGQPPYMGVNSETTRLMAAATRLDECFSRLEATNAEPELIAVCKRCLAADAQDRYADGTAVAQAVAALRAAADERARQADLERARSEVHAAEHARRRRTQLVAAGLISAVLFAGLIGTGVSYWKAEQQRELAEANEKRANEEKRVSDSTLKFFLDDMLGQADAKVQANARLKSGADIAPKANLTLQDLLARVRGDSTPEAMEQNFPGQPLAQARILRMVGRTYLGVGDARGAVEFLQRAYDLYRAHSPNQENDYTTLETLTELALANLDAGHTAVSRDQFQAILDYRIRTFGEEKLNTILSENNVAAALLAEGKFDEARARFARVQERLIALPKPELLSDQQDIQACILQAVHNLGVAIHRKARAEISSTGRIDTASMKAAISHFKAAYEGRLALLKSDHPDTLESLDNLAFATQESGEVTEAIQLYESVLATRLTARGEFHPQTLETRNKIAVAMLDGGRLSPDMLKEAIRRFEELAPLCEAKLGSEHIIALMVKRNLAQAYLEEIRLDGEEPTGRPRLLAAIKLLESVRRSFEKLLPESHNDRLQSLNILGFAYFLAGRHADAEACYAALLDTSHRVSGPFKPDPIETTHSLASVLKRTGKKDASVQLHRKTMEYLQESDFQHPDSTRYVIGLCNDFEEMGFWVEAEPWRRKVLVLLERVEGDVAESPSYSREATFFGRNLLKQQKWSEAARVLKRAWEIRRKHEQNKPSYFNTCSLYGEALMGEGKQEEAGPLLLEGYEGLKGYAETLPKDSRFIVADAGERLLRHYVSTRQEAKAAELKKELPKSGD